MRGVRVSDDDLRWYVPGFVGRRRRKAPERRIRFSSPDPDTVLVVTLNGDRRPPLARGKQAPSMYAAPDLARHRPTRYALALRRQATNRARRARGEQVLPAIGPGGCRGCDGWGVVAGERERCPRCLGSGEEG